MSDDGSMYISFVRLVGWQGHNLFILHYSICKVLELDELVKELLHLFESIEEDFPRLPLDDVNAIIVTVIVVGLCAEIII